MIVTDIVKIGDPQILLYEGKYYHYSTLDDGITDGFYARESEDLIHWSEPKLVLPKANCWGHTRFWAPEVVQRKDGKIVMHYTATADPDNKRVLRLGVAVADHPMGPFRDVHGKPMFELGYSTIDGSVLQCEEGNFFYYSRDCVDNIVDGVKTSQVYCVRLNEDLTEAVGEHMLMTTPTYDYERKSLLHNINRLWNEGPTVIRVGDKYVMNYSANYYGSNDYAICVASADHPLGPWKKSVNNPVLSCRKDLFGAGHNAFFTTKEGELYTSFHIQTNPESPSGDRRTVLGKVTFSEKNGDIFETIE